MRAIALAIVLAAMLSIRQKEFNSWPPIQQGFMGWLSWICFFGLVACLIGGW